jgi:hypothetical protein
MHLYLAVLLCLLALSSARLNALPQSPAPSDDYSGMYTFLKDGEFMQVTVEEQGKVSGFISRFGDSESDKGTFLDQFFKSGKIEGNKISFTTETVHGVWYSFEGAFARGEGKKPQDEGYYRLQGILTRNTADAEKKASAKVEFKSFPRDATPPQ